MNLKGVHMVFLKSRPRGQDIKAGPETVPFISRLGWLLDHPFAGLIKTNFLYGF